LDDISGSGQTAAAHGLCNNVKPANRQHLEVPGAGHYGIFSGRRWRDVVYPAVVKFILAHNDLGVKTKASSKTATKATVKAVAKKAPSRKK
jgi:poly(3-hydroxybutyrate) depolymerase